jgi:hypothetical protein
VPGTLLKTRAGERGGGERRKGEREKKEEEEDSWSSRI